MPHSPCLCCFVFASGAWRLWSIPEVRELMLEAGFSKADVYWEGPGKDGDGDGIYKKREKVENDDVWIAYIVGVK